MSTFFEYDYPVDLRDVDAWDRCRSAGILDILQEAATMAAYEVHISREEMLERYHCFWMLVRLWYRLERPLHWNEHLTVRTWHRGGKGVAMYRDFDLFCGGEQVGEAISTWALADLDTHKLFRLADVSEVAGSDGGELCKAKMLHRPKLPKDLSLTEQRPMRYSDCDINGHVNNVRYADFVCDALHMEKLGRESYVRQFQLGYLHECRPGETIAIFTGADGGRQYVHGVGADGVPRFDAAVELGWAEER